MSRMWVSWASFLAVLVLGPSSLLVPRPAGLPEPAPVVLPPRSAAAPQPTPADLLATRQLLVPVRGVPPARVENNFDDTRSGGRKHKAIDIHAPRGTPVLAADDGALVKISSNRAGGLSLYQADSSGRFVYYYAHLEGYAEGLREGQPVRRGDVIGYVGTSGNAPESAPHLHFAVMLLTPQGRWWGGEAINPYAAMVQAETIAAVPR